MFPLKIAPFQQIIHNFVAPKSRITLTKHDKMKLESVQPGKPKLATYLSLIAVVLFMGYLNYAVCIEGMTVKNTVWALTPALIAIVVSCFQGVDPQLMIISISACMAGAVCGDHCSPISDTTIMSSAGAQCEHMNHVTTQLPYAMTVAAVSFLTYLVAGFTKSAWISLTFGSVALFLLILFICRKKKTLHATS
jgi:Na+/H+ antiporter NhaC